MEEFVKWMMKDPWWAGSEGYRVFNMIYFILSFFSPALAAMSLSFAMNAAKKLSGLENKKFKSDVTIKDVCLILVIGYICAWMPVVSLITTFALAMFAIVGFTIGIYRKFKISEIRFQNEKNRPRTALEKYENELFEGLIK